MKKLWVLAVCFFVFLVFSSLNSNKLEAPTKDFNYFIAGNFFNSESSLEYSLPELRKVIQILNKGNNVFISFLENGSYDRTKEILSEFQFDLQVANKIVICNQSSSNAWKLNKILGAAYTNKLFKQRAGIRYQQMAVLRNLALEPLFSHKFANEYPVKVIFLNDVYFKAHQLLELLNTNEGKYDVVCALDFYYQFYDVLVARDMEGYWFSGYYPYTRHQPSKELLFKEQPFQVKACWNGITVFNPSPILSKQVQFRGRRFSDTNCECIQSECLFFCIDYLRNNFTQIMINPKIKLSYEWKYFALHYYLGPVIELIHSFWFDFKGQQSEEITGIGCSMPPYWEPEAPKSYMQIADGPCKLNLTNNEIYNSNLEWFKYEQQVYESYLQEFTQTCN